MGRAERALWRVSGNESHAGKFLKDAPQWNTAKLARAGEGQRFLAMESLRRIPASFVEPFAAYACRNAEVLLGLRFFKFSRLGRVASSQGRQQP